MSSDKVVMGFKDFDDARYAEKVIEELSTNEPGYVDIVNSSFLDYSFKVLETGGYTLNRMGLLPEYTEDIFGSGPCHTRFGKAVIADNDDYVVENVSEEFDYEVVIG